MEKIRYPKVEVNRLCVLVDGNKGGVLRRKTLKRTPNKHAAAVIHTHIDMCIFHTDVCVY